MSDYRQPQSPQPLHACYSNRPLPSYRFIPGLSPHPRRDLAGHSYGLTESKIAFMDAKDWSKNEEYLFGVDLYNHAFWWESHEAWEAVWLNTDKFQAYGQYLQGLIQISAAFIKWYLHQPEGLIKLYETGISRLEFVASSSPQFMGQDLTSHIIKLKKHFKPALDVKSNWPDPILNYPFIELEEG